MSGVLIALALIFTELSLLAFGGGMTILPEMQRQVVEVHQWMSAGIQRAVRHGAGRAGAEHDDRTAGRLARRRLGGAVGFFGRQVRAVFHRYAAGDGRGGVLRIARGAASCRPGWYR